MRVARRAGNQQARSATLASSSGMSAKVSGSVVLTPKSRRSMSRVKPKAVVEEREDRGVRADAEREVRINRPDGEYGMGIESLPPLPTHA